MRPPRALRIERSRSNRREPSPLCRAAQFDGAPDDDELITNDDEWLWGEHKKKVTAVTVTRVTRTHTPPHHPPLLACESREGVAG